jgi:hypothetical protein
MRFSALDNRGLYRLGVEGGVAAGVPPLLIFFDKLLV